MGSYLWSWHWAHPDGEPQPDRPHGIHAVDDLLDTPFLRVRAPFGIRGRVAMEAGGDVLLRRAVREQVARHLLDREPIEGHVRVERMDDPVAITPGVRPQGVTAKTVAVGVAGEVEPVATPLLAVVGRLEQPVEQVAVSAGARIVSRRHRLRLAWEAGRPGRDGRGEPAWFSRLRARERCPAAPVSRERTGRSDCEPTRNP